MKKFKVKRALISLDTLQKQVNEQLKVLDRINRSLTHLKALLKEGLEDEEK